MESRSVRTTMRDEAHNITYHVIALRILSRIEMYRIISEYRVGQKAPRRRLGEREATIIINALHRDSTRVQ